MDLRAWHTALRATNLSGDIVAVATGQVRAWYLASTSPQASSFQPGRPSPSASAEAPMPNTGTSKAIGVTVAAGCRASSQFQTP